MQVDFINPFILAGASRFGLLDWFIFLKQKDKEVEPFFIGRPT